MSYRVFARNFWREETNIYGQKKLVPELKPMDKCTTLYTVDTIEEAREICKEFNEGPRTPKQERLGYKYEFTSN